MANPTMPKLAEGAAEALSGTLNAGTGVEHMFFNTGPDDSPSGFSRFMNTEENMLNLLATAVAGLVINLNSGLNVGVYAIAYPIAGVDKSYAGDASYALPASETNNLYLDADQTLKNSTTGWPSGDHFKLAEVTTDVTSVTAVSDRRWQNFEIGGPTNWWTFAPTADADMAGFGFKDLGPLAAKHWSELTIATGSITPTQLLHSVDTEGDAGTDDLTDITAVAGTDNRRFLILAAENAARVVTVKSTGNITLNDGDFVMDSLNKFICLMQDSNTTWVECFRNFHTVTQLNAALDVNDQALNNFGRMNFNEADVTISSGQITVTAAASRYLVDTEGAAADDDLDTINGGSVGDILILQQKNSARDVTITQNGNIYMPTMTEYVLEGYNQIVLIFSASAGWTPLAHSVFTLSHLIPSVKAIPYTIGPTCLSGALSVKVYEIKVHCPQAFTLKNATGIVNTAPSGGACIIDIRKNGTSIFADQSEMINIADGTTSDTSATKNTSIAADDVLTFEVEAANSAANATIMINGYAALQTPP